jgi:hypothetical protein
MIERVTVHHPNNYNAKKVTKPETLRFSINVLAEQKIQKEKLKFKIFYVW